MEIMDKKDISDVKRWEGHPAEDYRGLTMYQVMVGSFIHSENGAQGYSEMWGPDNETKDGNLQGVIEALQHIRSLGANAVWLTPIFDSTGAVYTYTRPRG